MIDKRTYLCLSYYTNKFGFPSESIVLKANGYIEFRYFKKGQLLLNLLSKIGIFFQTFAGFSEYTNFYLDSVNSGLWKAEYFQVFDLRLRPNVQMQLWPFFAFRLSALKSSIFTQMAS